jgi:hypothetical protein
VDKDLRQTMENEEIEIPPGIEDVKKYKYWKENREDFETWEEFDENCAWCRLCQSYSDRQCICYAR